MTDLRRIVAAGILGAVLASVLALVATSFGATTYRAETDLAVLPSSALSPDQVPAFWEALSRGQVPRTAAEVFNQPRWLAEAARVAGRPASSLTMTAGVVPDTTLLKVTLEADSRAAAEQGLRAVVDAASPQASAAAGPFVLIGVYGPEGTATPVGSSLGTLLPIVAIAGLLLGGGIAVLFLRRRYLLASIGFAWGGDSTSPPPAESASVGHPEVPASLSVPGARRAHPAGGEPGFSPGAAPRRISMRRIDRSSFGHVDDDLLDTDASTGDDAGVEDDEVVRAPSAGATGAPVDEPVDREACPDPDQGADRVVAQDVGDEERDVDAEATRMSPGQAAGKTKRKTGRADHTAARR